MLVVVAPEEKIVWALAALLANWSVPATLLSVPSEGVAVNAPVEPFGICPAAPESEIAPAALMATGVVPLRPDVPTAEMAILLLATAMPLSVRVQVVPDTTQVIMSVVVGTVAKPRIVFDAVAALPQVVVKLPDAGNMESVPAAPEIPNVGV